MGLIQSNWLLKLRLRFRLRSFLVAFTLVSIVLGLYISRAQEQKGAVAAIERLGGTVIYDYQYYVDELDQRCIGLSRKPADNWGVHLLGRDYFHSVAGVWGFQEHSSASIGGAMHSFGPMRMSTEFDERTDECLSLLAGVHSLVFLNLRETAVSDAGLTHLRKLPSLNRLDLCECNITDEGLRTLASVNGLSELILFNTKVTEKGVRRLLAVKPKLEIWHPVTAEVVDGAWVQRKRPTFDRPE